jgi:hypothetical protein
MRPSKHGRHSPAHHERERHHLAVCTLENSWLEEQSLQVTPPPTLSHTHIHTRAREHRAGPCFTWKAIANSKERDRGQPAAFKLANAGLETAPVPGQSL